MRKEPVRLYNIAIDPFEKKNLGLNTKSCGEYKFDRTLDLKKSMSSDTLLAIANLLLPEVLVKYFDLICS